ncbi:hypothetical protein [Bacillus phage vB_BanS-Thrax2]|nr:hypothetical protein [Bacillus phage vB_BanS-Thrax2]
MRFVFGNKKQPIVGQTRIIGKFLLFPKVINRELRWLEYSYYEQVAIKVNVGDIWEDRYKNKWINKKWVNINDKYPFR